MRQEGFGSKEREIAVHADLRASNPIILLAVTIIFVRVLLLVIPLITNRSCAFRFKDFVNEAISKLIERGCVMEVDIPPVFINPLHVVQQSSGKCRLTLDLSYLNTFVWKQFTYVQKCS